MSPLSAEPGPTDAEPRYYPDRGPWAVAARLSLVVSVIAIAFASLSAGRHVPRLLSSYHLEHFAAFYVAALIAGAAFPRGRLRFIGMAALLMALGLESGPLFWGRGLQDSYYNLLSDVGGAAAAIIPIAVDRFRRMFGPRQRAA